MPTRNEGRDQGLRQAQLLQYTHTHTHTPKWTCKE
jgi:hypothetical protein